MARISQVTRLALRFVVGALFVWAAVAKLRDPGGFAFEIERFRLTPWSISAAAAVYLPWLEGFAGAAFVFGRGLVRRGAHVVLLALTVLFACALGSAMARGLDIHCGCFGASAATGQIPLALGRDLAIMLALVYLLVAGERKPPEQRSHQPAA